MKDSTRLGTGGIKVLTNVIPEEIKIRHDNVILRLFVVLGGTECLNMCNSVRCLTQNRSLFDTGNNLLRRDHDASETACTALS